MKEIDTSKLLYNSAFALSPRRIQIGSKVGKLKVLEYLGYSNTDTDHYYKCLCDCGNISYNSEKNLKDVLMGNRNSISCGCAKIEHAKNMRKYVNNDNLRKNIYPVDCKARGHLAAIRQRCYNPNNKKYKNYGARGITVCDQWMDPDNGYDIFCDWMYREEGYRDDMCIKGDTVSIERINVNKGYSPENCTLAYNSVQASNTTSNRNIYWYGNRHTVQQLAKRFSKPVDKITRNLKDGMPLPEILVGPEFGSGGGGVRRKVMRESPNGLVLTPKAFVKIPFKFVDHSEISASDRIRFTEWPNYNIAMNDIALSRRLDARDAGHPVKPFQFTDGKSDDFLCSYVSPTYPTNNIEMEEK